MGSFIERMFGRRLDTGTLPGPPDERRAAVIRNWTYYHGRDDATGRTQWSYLRERFETMPHREYEGIENHIRICVDRLRRLLVNSWRGFDFGSGGDEGAVRSVLDYNRWPRLLNLAALYGKVTGDAFFKLIPASENPPFSPVRIVLLDSEAVTLDVSPHDRDDVRSVTITYGYFDRDRGGNGDRNADGEERDVRRSYREIIDHNEVTAFVDGEYAPEYSYRHGLGFIPVVHVRDHDTGGGVYGESLAGRLIEAQDAVNLIAGDLMDIVRHDGHKTTVFQNVNIDRGASRDGMTPGEVDLSIGKGLVVKGEGKVYKLDQQHDLGAALEEYERKLDALYDLAGVPRFSRDMISSLGNLSGRAIERLYQDAIEGTREAQCLYGQSFSELLCKIALMTGTNIPQAEAIWNTDVIAPDSEALAREHEIGARSIRSVMRKLGITDTDAMLAEIREEREGLRFGQNEVNQP